MSPILRSITCHLTIERHRTPVRPRLPDAAPGPHSHHRAKSHYLPPTAVALSISTRTTSRGLSEPTTQPLFTISISRAPSKMSEDWESVTKIGSKVRGPGVANRETTIKGKSALNAAARSGAIIGTEKKFASANVSLSQTSAGSSAVSGEVSGTKPQLELPALPFQSPIHPNPPLLINSSSPDQRQPRRPTSHQSRPSRRPRRNEESPRRGLQSPHPGTE
jgi:hypothetical protein